MNNSLLTTVPAVGKSFMDLAMAWIFVTFSDYQRESGIATYVKAGFANLTNDAGNTNYQKCLDFFTNPSVANLHATNQTTFSKPKGTTAKVIFITAYRPNGEHLEILPWLNPRTKAACAPFVVQPNIKPISASNIVWKGNGFAYATSFENNKAAQYRANPDYFVLTLGTTAIEKKNVGSQWVKHIQKIALQAPFAVVTVGTISFDPSSKSVKGFRLHTARSFSIPLTDKTGSTNLLNQVVATTPTLVDF